MNKNPSSGPRAASAPETSGLSPSESRYRRLFEAAQDGILLLDATTGLIEDVNPCLVRMLGYPRDDFLGRKLCETRPFADTALVRERLAPLQFQDFVRCENLPLTTACGDAIEVEFVCNAYECEGTRFIRCSLRDISGQKKVEDQLLFAASVFTHAREGIMITAPDGSILDVNDAFTLITGYPRAEVLGRNPRFLNSGRQDRAFYSAMWRTLIENGHWYGEIWNRRKNGSQYAAILNISAVRDTEGNIRQYMALFTDITSLKEHEYELEQIAHYDALTGLPNRVLLADRMRLAMAQATRRGQEMAVVFLDLDGFKAINDSHGHDVGDQLLIALGNRFRQILREGDTFARIGGDEFVAVLPDLVNAEACEPLLDRILKAALRPIPCGKLSLHVSASLGVTFYPQKEEIDADQLLRQADQAMYQAKLTGKNRYHIFDDELDRTVRGHHEKQAEIRRALQRHEFVLYYQPKVNMRTGEMIGAEALIRWQHPDKGLLLPAMFLPAVEQNPLAIEIGEWVIDSALAQIEAWRLAGTGIQVSVNIGAYQLEHANFVERLGKILKKHPNIRAGDLQLEVLESSALSDLSKISAIIKACEAIGVNFAIDDFGTGYSSLTYLKHLPVNKLKLDQSFVCDKFDNPDNLAILKGVLGLADVLHCQIIAEGVETVEHGELLLNLGCELAQGYGIALPMPAGNFLDWVATWRPDSVWRTQSPPPPPD